MIKNLLLIDDDAIDQKIYRRIIDKSGLVENYRCFTYADEAIAYLRKPDRPAIDAILLDIRMPRMDGFEFLEAATVEFGDSFTKVAVIMLTTSTSAHDRNRANEFAVVKAYITKPLELSHLAMIDDLLNQRSA